MYLLKRIDQKGGYVARPGLHKAYTTISNNVRIFATKEDAERNRCVENEIVVPLSSVIRR